MCNPLYDSVKIIWAACIALPYRKFMYGNYVFGTFLLLSNDSLKKYGIGTSTESIPELCIFPDHEKSIKFTNDTEKTYSL